MALTGKNSKISILNHLREGKRLQLLKAYDHVNQREEEILASEVQASLGKVKAINEMQSSLAREEVEEASDTQQSERTLSLIGAKSSPGLLKSYVSKRKGITIGDPNSQIAIIKKLESLGLSTESNEKKRIKILSLIITENTKMLLKEREAALLRRLKYHRSRKAKEIKVEGRPM